MRDPEDDLIRRQTAIDVLDRNHILGQGLLNDTLDHIADAIMALPSAQPETHEERTETHACDCISRQAAQAYCYRCKVRIPVEMEMPPIVDALPHARQMRIEEWLKEDLYNDKS